MRVEQEQAASCEKLDIKLSCKFRHLATSKRLHTMYIQSEKKPIAVILY